MTIKNKYAEFVGAAVIGFACGVVFAALGAPFWLTAVVAGVLIFFYDEDVGETVCSLFGGNKES